MIEAKEQLGSMLLPDVPMKSSTAEGRDSNCSQQSRKELRSEPERDLTVGLRGQC